MNNLSYKSQLGDVFTIANCITMCRILATPIFVILLLGDISVNDQFRLMAFALFLFVVLTDFVDGKIARFGNHRTALGAILDPLADKIFLISGFICLYFIGESFPVIHFPLWFIIIIICRDAILLVGSIFLFFIRSDVILESSKLGKLSTVFQFLSMGGMLLQLKFSPIFWIGTILFAICSGFGYIRVALKSLKISVDQKLPILHQEKAKF